jgi:hypothetical protein
MPLPEVLIKLLTAAGPSGYEGPHRRDRADRHPHRRRGLPVVPAVGGWDAQILVGQRVRAGHQRRAGDGRGGQEADPPAARGGPQEGGGASASCTSTSAPRRRRGARARADRRRRGDRRRAGRAPNGRFTSRCAGQPPGAFVALEAARLVAEAGGAPGSSRPVAVAQEEITFGGSRTPRSRSSPTRRSSWTSRTRPTLRASTSRRSASTSFGSGPVLGRGSILNPAAVRAAARDAKREEIPFTVEASRAPPAPTPTRSTSAARGVPTGAGVDRRSATCTPRSSSSSSTTSTCCARLIAAFALAGRETSFAR